MSPNIVRHSSSKTLELLSSFAAVAVVIAFVSIGWP